MPRKATGQNRLRIGRVSESGRIYLVTIVTRGRRPIFAELYAGRALVQALMAGRDTSITLCYVVMPDHLHWLLQLRDGASLSRTVQKAMGMETKAIDILGYLTCP